MENEHTSFSLSRNSQTALYIVSVLTLLLHLFTNLFAGYGIFRDELYYLACTGRLSAGYVDQPPLSIYMLAISKWIFGESLFAIRLLPAVSAAVTVYFAGLITARIGGKLIAVLIAVITLTFSPVFIGMNSVFSMNTFDHLLWVLSAYLVLRIVQENKPVFWLLLGITIGSGMLNKISMIWFGAGLTIGIIFSPLRSSLKTKWPFLTAIISFLIFSPFIVWNITHDFAHLEFINNATIYKYSTLTPFDFISGQILLAGPVSMLVWLSGLIYLLFSKDVVKFRILAIIFLTTFIILILNWHSKAEYLAPAYPLVFAGGGLFIEKIFKGKSLGWIKYVLISLIIISGIIAMPVVLPILPVQTFISYSDSLGLSHQNSENKELAELPQYYADMFGWEEMTKTVASVYETIPDSERASTVIFANNYGEAGAIEYYSSRYTLPPVVCPHNSFWYWTNPDNRQITTVIAIGGNIEDLKASCRNVTIAAVHKTIYSMPYENNLPIYICRDIYRPLKQIWKQAKRFI